MTWQEVGHKILDDYERGACNELFSMKSFAQKVQRNRSTVWRDNSITERIKKLREAGLLTERQERRPPARASAAQQIRRLTLECERLQKECDGHNQNYLVIYRRLQDQNVDPVSIMDGLGPKLKDSKGRPLVLQW